MSTQRETPRLILSLLITLALVSVGIWWSAGQLPGVHLLSITGRSGGDRPIDDLSGDDLSGDDLSTEAIQARISSGERVLIADGALPEKQAGTRAIAAGSTHQAVNNLENALRVNPNDPEALIYLNNARLADQKTYTIAVSVPLSHDLNSALEVLRGVAQTQNEINQSGGIGGIPLRVLIADDANRPALARAIAQSLVNDPHVLGIVGHCSSEAALAAAPIYEQNGLVAISPISTSVDLSNAGAYIFRTVPSNFVAARALAEQMLNQLHQQRAAVLFDSQNRDSQSLKAEFVTALSLGGGQVLREIDLAKPGFSALDSINQAAQQGATTLVLLPSADELDRALQVVQVNGGRFSLLASGEVYSPKTLEIGGSEAVGIIAAVPWHILSDPQSSFGERSRQLWQGDVNWRTATAYDAAQALVTALAVGSTRLGIQQALRSDTFYAPGATGTVRFLPSGDRNQGVSLVTIQPGSRSGFGFDFVPTGFGISPTEPQPLGVVPNLTPEITPNLTPRLVADSLKRSL